MKTDKELQSWLDRRITASSQTAVQKALEKARLLADEKASEAEKLAAMNEKERQAYELKKAQGRIAALEAEKNARELRETAITMAKEQGLRTPRRHVSDDKERVGPADRKLRRHSVCGPWRKAGNQ